MKLTPSERDELSRIADPDIRIKTTRAMAGRCPECGMPEGVNPGACPGHCLSCGGRYSEPKGRTCTGPHTISGDVEALRRIVVE